MQLRRHLERRDSEGYAIIMSMVLSGVSLLLLSAALSWTSTSAVQTQRNNEFFNSGSAAEAATDKVLSAISQSYQTHDESEVYTQLSSFQNMVPTRSEDPNWANYEFSDAQGRVGSTYVSRITPWAWGELPAGYSSMKGYRATYRIVSNAKLLKSANQKSVSALKREVGLVSIPVFEFGIFFAIDLEFNPADTWNVSGPVHANSMIYVEPNRTLTFSNKVTSTQKIVHDRSPGDPINRSAKPIYYLNGRVEGVKSLNLPLGVPNSPENLRQIVELPPMGESPTSPMGRQRYYNKADLNILVSDTSVVAKSGAYNNFAITIPWSTISTFLRTNIVFFDKRESVDIQATEIDIVAFNARITTLTSLLGRQPKTLYINDSRTQSSLTKPGVRLVNGNLLPAGGLSVATPNPLYVKGDYNHPTMVVKGQTVPDPSKRVGASLISDAFTYLSNDWIDADSTKSLTTRDVKKTATLNAGIITGLVPSGGGYYSGGVEGTIRFLEYWGSRTMAFSGSLVVLYPSKIATSPWGATSDVYELPTRSWRWDTTFLEPSKLPPATPELRAVVRSQWSTLAPNTLN